MKNRVYQKLAILMAFAIFLFSPLYSTDYYVDGTNGSNANNGFSPTMAKKTIQAAADLTKGGDTVFVMNGIYESTSVNGNLIKITRSGTAGNYITFKPMKGHSPKLKASGGSWECIIVDASYIIIDGFEFEGNNANITYAAAYKSWQDYNNNIRDWTLIPNFNTNCMSIGKNVNVNHIVVRNCKVHDFPAGGIGGGKMDYVTIENNTIYNNCWYTMYATSGISVMGEYNSDNVTSYKIIVRNNVLYNNKTTVPWHQTKALSDGNGIIADINNPGGVQYNGRTLIENNICYNNGGGGIHAYGASHIDIINNTAYNNGTVVGYPEIDGQGGSDVKIYNNIMYARTGGNCNRNDGAATYDYNMYFNGPAFRQGAHDVVADPQFIRLALDSTANFNLNIASRAVNAGSSIAGQFSAKDILGIARPVGARSDMGAYENIYGDQKTDQTITFPALANMKVGDADLNPGATASSGLPITYTSSNTSVAAIVNGKIQVTGAGTTTIIASQNGSTSYNGADARQNLTVTGTNILTNGNFDAGISGWRLGKSAGADFGIESVAQTGYTSNVCKATVTNMGTGTPSPWNMQLYVLIPLIKDRTYSVKFKASADSARLMDMACQSNASPYTRYYTTYNIKLTKTPTTFGPYTFTSTANDVNAALKFLLGINAKAVYIDDIEVTESAAPEMNIKQGASDILDNTGSYAFEPVKIGQSKTVGFTIENTGNRTLNLSASPMVTVSGAGFSLASDAATTVNSGCSSAFEVTFTPLVTGAYSGTVSIANSDGNENPYNFTITATGIKADQTIAFDSLPSKIYGDADFALGATASSGLPVSYISSDTSVAVIANSTVHIVGAGSASITATQAGDTTYNAAAAVSQMLMVAKADQTIAFIALPSKVYGDADFALPATASTGLPVSYESSNTAVATVVNGNIHIIAAGTTTITALQEGNTNFNAAPAVSQTLTIAPMTLEAEDAYLYLGKIFSNKAGFTGSGFVGHLVPFKGYIEWTVNAPETGLYELNFRYSLGASARVLKLDVNGSTVISSLVFPNTGSWTTWQTVPVVVNLNAGANTIRTTATLASVPNMDNLTVAKSAETEPSTTLSELMDLVNKWIVVAYPNPASDMFKVDVPAAIGEQIKVCLFDLGGRMVFENIYLAPQNGKNTLEIDVNNLLQGMYLVKIITEKGSKSGLVMIRR